MFPAHEVPYDQAMLLNIWHGYWRQHIIDIFKFIYKYTGCQGIHRILMLLSIDLATIWFCIGGIFEKSAGLPDPRPARSASWFCALLPAAAYRGKNQDVGGWNAQKTHRYIRSGLARLALCLARISDLTGHQTSNRVNNASILRDEFRQNNCQADVLDAIGPLLRINKNGAWKVTVHNLSTILHT